MFIAQSVNHDLDTRMQALTLTEQRIAVKIIEVVTQLSRRSMNRLQKQARARDYDPEKSQQLRLKYVIDAFRSDRFSIVISEVKQIILKTIRKDKDD